MAPLFDIHIASMPQTDLHFVLNIVGIANLDMFGPLVVDNLQQWLTLSTLALDVKAKHTGLIIAKWQFAFQAKHSLASYFTSYLFGF